MTPEELALLIDQTLLKPQTTVSEIENLCLGARGFGFANVCVNPWHVSRCAALLAGSGVGVCTVVGFPLGANTTEIKAKEAERACADGASEIDMVLNLGAFLSDDHEACVADVTAVVTAVSGEALVKVILETGLLNDVQKEAACSLAVDGGADFVKTSTGFGPGGATAPDVALLRRAVGPRIGVKAAGGIRSAEQALELLRAGATRLGTSSGETLVNELQAGAS
jgi:deoxyribose-phosphate aldolase